jgi:hypothetical protein
MQTSMSSSERRRDILTAIGREPVIIEGTLTVRERKRGGPKVAVYHQVQRWRDGRNETRHVPAERVDAVRHGIEGYQRVQALISDLARLDEQSVLATGPEDSKKKPTRR